MAAVRIARACGRSTCSWPAASSCITGGLAELATGEGKTLVAALPAFLNALAGKGVHVTTVNDYLARRDAEWIGPIYQALGLTVGVLQKQMPDAGPHARPTAATSPTARPRSSASTSCATGSRSPATRGRRRRSGTPGCEPAAVQPAGSTRRCSATHHYALVDEADNIFIDEARTPLIIATADAAGHAGGAGRLPLGRRAGQGTMVRDEHFTLDEKKQKIELTDEGRHKAALVQPAVRARTRTPWTSCTSTSSRRLHAHYRFRRDQHYMIEKDKVVIIDEFTGRRMPDRHWREGLHQAVEAKEGVPITKPSDHAAQITFQSYFRLYKKLAGMTGTAAQNCWEMRRVYKIWVVLRADQPAGHPRAAGRTASSRPRTPSSTRWSRRSRGCTRLGRPVLIGTRSVEKSEKLSARLQAGGHRAPGAQRQAARAGGGDRRPGRRGRPGDHRHEHGRPRHRHQARPGVAAAGGLHVLGTERHEAARIDRQLAGRAGRQGDPGSSQFFLSLDDELLEILGTRRQQAVRRMGRQEKADDWQQFARLFRTAQRQMESRHYRQRIDVLRYEKQRQEILKDLGADPYVD